MAKKKKLVGRKYIIGDLTYFIYKNNKHIYVELDDEVVYSNKKNTLTVSMWLKNKVKNYNNK